MKTSPEIDNLKGSTAWYNYSTKEYDYLQDAPEDYLHYVPAGAGQNMYRLLVDEMGKTPQEAAIQVLTAACGE